MMRFAIFLFFVFLLNFNTYSQNINRAKKLIKKLSSKEFEGRGYVNNGAEKAGKYLSKQFKKTGLKPFNAKHYFQDYTFNVNTFPGNIELYADGRKLVPGKHFLVTPESNGIKGVFNMSRKDSLYWVSEQISGETPLIAEYVKKLTWSVATEQAPYCHLQFLKDSFPSEIKKIEITLQQQFLRDYRQTNICGYIPGTEFPDSFLVISAHYDHLGKMGNQVFFPGANDNASGVSMLMELAHFFAKNPQKYSVAFLLFSGEEAGLLGSAYFVNHPLIPLTKIRFLLNLDLLGTGDEGITVVNATEYPVPFSHLKNINESKNLLPQIKPRGKAKNSDHYWFTERGVPSFFIYTMGGIKAYHDVYDIPETLPLTKFYEVFILLRDFVISY